MEELEKQSRFCPCCGEVRGRLAMASAPAGEDLPLSALRQQWAGLHRNKAFFSYVRCAACGLLYNPVYFASHALAQLYADLAPNMDMVPPGMIAQTQRGYYDAIERAGAPEGDYLEIGPDIGHMVTEAAQRGAFRHFWLYEPNRAIHHTLGAAAQGRPCTISDRMMDLSAVPDGSVGLAVMVHVLDHLAAPLAMVRQIACKLCPDGLLAIVTHNESSALRYLTGRRWPPFCLQHPQLFSPATITGLLRRAGFDRPAVTPTRNVFPADFLVQQGGQALGLDLGRLPFPSTPVRLPLGNMLTLARTPGG